MNKADKIYVAGHTGMVGSAIYRKLKEEGFSNIVVRELSELNLLEGSTVKDFFEQEKPDYVFLAAAKVGGIHANNTYRAQFIYENLQIQNNVIHQSYLSGVKKLLFLGSSCIYPKMAPQPIKEEYLLTGELESTNEPYAIAKITGIKMCEAYRSQYGCNFISVMPTNLYGSNDNYNLENSHVLPALIRKMHLGKCLENNDLDSLLKNLSDFPVSGISKGSGYIEIINRLSDFGIKVDGENKVSVEVWGTGTPKREFLHVDDLAEAVYFLMQNYNKEQFLNIGCGEDISIKDLAYLVKEIVGFSGDLFFNNDKPDGTPRKLLDVQKLYDTGFRPKYSLFEGIESVYKNTFLS